MRIPSPRLLGSVLAFALLPWPCAPHGRVAAAPDDGPAGAGGSPPPLSAYYERVARLEVPVEEISGMAPLPGGGPSARAFLAVSDDGRRRPDAPLVEGSLFRVELRVQADRAVEVARVTPVTLDLGGHVPHLDPAWASAGGWPPDLEACVPLPGTQDLFLLGGERGAEDASDGGANRVYLVRYPAGDEDRAELRAAFRFPDEEDDGINDRIEALAAVSHAAGPGRWLVWTFKERTQWPGRVPCFREWVLERDGQGFAWRPSAPSPGAPPGAYRRGFALLRERERLGAQADACVAPDGSIWVLDRWRREVHVAASPQGLPLALRHDHTLDLFDLVRDVPDETGTDEPAAPGSPHAGYGRHEALCFDAQGWLWLVADLGRGRPSVVTVLAPRGAVAGDG